VPKRRMVKKTHSMDMEPSRRNSRSARNNNDALMFWMREIGDRRQHTSRPKLLAVAYYGVGLAAGWVNRRDNRSRD